MNLFLCFFLPRLGENHASAHFQGNPIKYTWKFFFWLGGTENNTIFSYFRNFRIFPTKRLIFPDGGSNKQLSTFQLLKYVLCRVQKSFSPELEIVFGNGATVPEQVRSRIVSFMKKSVIKSLLNSV